MTNSNGWDDDDLEFIVDEDEAMETQNSDKQSSPVKSNGQMNQGNNQKAASAALQNYEADEFGLRIQAYQDILRDNEQTIKTFKAKVTLLEKQVDELTAPSQTTIELVSKVE